MIINAFKYKIVNSLLRANIFIGQKLSFYNSKYSSEEEINSIIKSGKSDLRYMKNKFKALRVYDIDIREKRLNECLNCEHLFKPTNSCKICKCFVKEKIKWAGQSCPKGKWGKVLNGIEITT